MTWLVANWGLIATVLLGISEALALIPGIQANSILTGLINFLKSIGTKDPEAK